MGRISHKSKSQKQIQRAKHRRQIKAKQNRRKQARLVAVIKERKHKLLFRTYYHNLLSLKGVLYHVPYTSGNAFIYHNGLVTTLPDGRIVIIRRVMNREEQIHNEGHLFVVLTGNIRITGIDHPMKFFTENFATFSLRASFSKLVQNFFS